jgi:benzoate membrane transport protein
MRFSVISSAFVAAIIGIGSTLALLIAAAQALGASEAQTASWVTAICLAKVFETGYLSWRYKMPIVTAWSTAGLALIGASVGFSMAEGVGAFIIAGLLLILTGLFKPLTNLVARIPNGVSAGMLAGILLPFVIAGAQTAGVDPIFVLPLLALFFIARLFNPPLASIAVLVVGLVYAILRGDMTDAPNLTLSRLEWITPEFSFAAIIGIGLPLYLVTMASQNLPGVAVLRASGYNPPAGPLIAVTGLFSTLSAFFGASSTNLAAITAAICTGEDAHPDKDKRWITGLFYAFFYLVFAIFGASLVSLFVLLPAVFVSLVVALALLAACTNATSIALTDEKQRIAAMATLAVTASGVSFFGVGAAFWGLIVGLIIVGLQGAKERMSA